MRYKRSRGRLSADSSTATVNSSKVSLRDFHLNSPPLLFTSLCCPVVRRDMFMLLVSESRMGEKPRRGQQRVTIISSMKIITSTESDRATWLRSREITSQCGEERKPSNVRIIYANKKSALMLGARGGEQTWDRLKNVNDNLSAY